MYRQPIWSLWQILVTQGRLLRVALCECSLSVIDFTSTCILVFPRCRHLKRWLREEIYSHNTHDATYSILTYIHLVPCCELRHSFIVLLHDTFISIKVLSMAIQQGNFTKLRSLRIDWQIHLTCSWNPFYLHLIRLKWVLRFFRLIRECKTFTT